MKNGFHKQQEPQLPALRFQRGKQREFSTRGSFGGVQLRPRFLGSAPWISPGHCPSAAS